MKIGFFGGMFDPIHIGHLNIAQRAVDSGIVDKVMFVPTNIPPHKPGIISAEYKQRYQMVNIAISDNPDFQINDIERNIKGKSYTYNTLELLKNKFDDDFFLIIGQDQLASFHTWYEYKKILEKYPLVVFNRGLKDISNNMNEYIKNINMINVENDHIPFSSTEIRERMKKRSGIRYMVTEKVFKYINENNVYDFLYK